MLRYQRAMVRQKTEPASQRGGGTEVCLLYFATVTLNPLNQVGYLAKMTGRCEG